MKLSKNDAKKLAKTAKSIVSTEASGMYDGGSYQKETAMTYDEMIASLKDTSRWFANQHGNQVFINSAIHNITINL